MVGMKAINLAPKPDAIRAYELTFDNKGDIFELLGAKRVHPVIRSAFVPANFNLFLIYELEDGTKFEMRMAEGPIPGDYLVKVDGEWQVFDPKRLNETFVRLPDSDKI